MKRWSPVVLVLSLVAVVAVAADTVSRVFTLRHAQVSEVSAAVQPMLSENGLLTLQPKQSRLTVQDVPEVVERVAARIAELDHVPDRFRIEVELLEGGPESPFGAVTEVPANDRLRKMFRFAAYQRLGSAVLEGDLGSSVQADLGSGFRVSFLAQLPAYSQDSPWGSPDPGDRVHLRGLMLERVSIGEGGERSSEQVLRTSVLLAPAQEVYIGAGDSENATTGWVLIVRALGAGDR
jgi:hypothetical protein